MPIGAYDQGSGDRGLSTKLWLPIPGSAESDPRYGVRFVEDFHTVNSGDYTLTQATAGTFAIDGTDTSNGGVALLDCASSTVTQGGNLQWDGPVVTPTAGRTIVFECRLKVEDSATGPEFFAGLSDAETAIIASSAVASDNYVGFFSVTDDNVLLFASEDGGTQVAEATPHTLVESTYVKLGFQIIGTGDSAGEVRIFVDGAEVAVANTPDCPAGTPLFPSFVCQSNGTTDPIVHLDWFAVGVSPE